MNVRKQEEINVYRLFTELLNYGPQSEVNTLIQISLYIVRNNLKIKNIENSELGKRIILLDNGMTIEYSVVGDFGFTLINSNDDMKVKTVVSLSELGNLAAVNVYSELDINKMGMYVVAFRPTSIFDSSSLKYGVINFYTNDEIDWVKEITKEEIDNNFDLVAKKNGIFPFAEKSEFDLIEQDSNQLDLYQGYISEVLNRIDLLYNNVSMINCKKKKKVNSNF